MDTSKDQPWITKQNIHNFDKIYNKLEAAYLKLTIVTERDTSDQIVSVERLSRQKICQYNNNYNSIDLVQGIKVSKGIT